MTIALLSIPYFLGGLYIKKIFKEKRKFYALLIPTITTITERLFILFVGNQYYQSGGDGNTLQQGMNLITFIRGEAAPYFSIPYIFVGMVISILITYTIATQITNK